MNTAHSSASGFKLTPFQIFKYIIYFLLIRNIFVFYAEESAAIAVMHPDGFGWLDFINVYAATIDTFNWVVLLMLFELETWVIPDDKLTAPIKLLFTALRMFCYAWICYAVFGYFITYVELGEWQPSVLQGSELCNNLGKEFMFSLERFDTVTASNCRELAVSAGLLTNGESLIVDTHHYQLAWMLAVADVINATDWLLIVLILEAEVWIQSRHQTQSNLKGGINVIKLILYAILGTVAVFWGFFGEFIDFWDAFLWIVAFMFIENNVLEWSKETDAEPDSVPLR